MSMGSVGSAFIELGLEARQFFADLRSAQARAQAQLARPVTVRMVAQSAAVQALARPVVAAAKLAGAALARYVGEPIAFTGALAARSAQRIAAAFSAIGARIAAPARAAMAAVGNAFRAAGAPLAASFAEVFRQVGPRLARVLGPVLGAAAGAAGVLGRAGGAGLRGAGGLASGLGSVASGLGAAFMAVAPRIASVLGSVARGATSAFGGMARTTTNLLAAGAIVATRAFVGAAGRIGSALGSAGGKLLGALGRTAAGAVEPGMDLARYSAGEAISMETRMYRLSRVTGLSGDELGKLGDEFRGMAATMAGVPLEKIFDIAEVGAKLGVGASGIRLFTRDMSMLSAVLDENDMPLADMVTGISKMLTIFGRGSHEAINFAATLNRLDLISAATGRDILDIATRMAPGAATFRISPQHTMALAAAMSQAGVPRETAGTATSQLFMRMASRKTQPAFARLAGMGTENFSNLLRVDALGALKAVAQGVQGMDPQEASRALDDLKLDGQRVRLVLLALARTLGTLDNYVAESDKEWNSLASILRSFGEVGETTAAQLDLLWNNLKLTAAELGKSLLPIIKGFAEGMRGLLSDVRASLEANAETFKAWGRTVGKALQYIKLLWREFPRFVDLGVVIALEKWEQLVEILKRIGTVGRNVFESLGEFLGDLFEQIGKNLSAQITNAIAQAVVGNRAVAGVVGWALGQEVVTGLKILAADNEVPKIKPKTDLFGKNLFKGLQDDQGKRPVDWFTAIFGNLPDRMIDMQSIILNLTDSLRKMNKAAADQVAAQRAKDAAERALAKAREEAQAQLKNLLLGKAPPPPPGPAAQRRARQQQAQQARQQQQARARAALGVRPRAPRRKPGQPAPRGPGFRPGIQPRLPIPPGAAAMPRLAPPAQRAAMDKAEQERKREKAKQDAAKLEALAQLPPGDLTPKQAAERRRLIHQMELERDAAAKIAQQEAADRAAQEKARMDQARQRAEIQQRKEDDAARFIPPDPNRGRAGVQEQLRQMDREEAEARARMQKEIDRRRADEMEKRMQEHPFFNPVPGAPPAGPAPAEEEGARKAAEAGDLQEQALNQNTGMLRELMAAVGRMTDEFAQVQRAGIQLNGGPTLWNNSNA